MRVDDQACWVLHRKAWRESSLLVELFTRDHGRIGLVARAARGARSPWRGMVEPFCPLQAAWSRRGELGTLTALEPSSARIPLSGQALWCGLYLNELLLVLLDRDEPMPDLFEAYGRALTCLLDPDRQARALRRFECELLASLGVLPDLACNATDGAAIVPEGLYHVLPETGLVPVEREGAAVVHGQAALFLAGEIDQADAEIRREARLLTRWLIDHQLGGRSLKTRELLRGGQRRTTTGDSR
ncbi:DNA repair protein RecO [Wenzhouxiangella marina]|uniref:DNA repair protein RecO n=1 Tax=Wenzhouxiangella marina TaxID=1579979 RepID=A0A0K0XXV0_9GAMM|nr:DNA repair protein RecO [Wenzhouxiangella marina]AKS42436.1 DNA repair protein RecO [Wenzhouxiangella marina]MBB6085789.1 DNA repair protein RecO (recombination protein O) [Wenzhouxiangella marina]